MHGDSLGEANLWMRTHCSGALNATRLTWYTWCIPSVDECRLPCCLVVRIAQCSSCICSRYASSTDSECYTHLSMKDVGILLHTTIMPSTQDFTRAVYEYSTDIASEASRLRVGRCWWTSKHHERHPQVQHLAHPIGIPFSERDFRACSSAR